MQMQHTTRNRTQTLSLARISGACLDEDELWVSEWVSEWVCVCVCLHVPSCVGAWVLACMHVCRVRARVHPRTWVRVCVRMYACARIFIIIIIIIISINVDSPCIAAMTVNGILLRGPPSVTRATMIFIATIIEELIGDYHMAEEHRVCTVHNCRCKHSAHREGYRYSYHKFNNGNNNNNNYSNNNNNYNNDNNYNNNNNKTATTTETTKTTTR